MLEIEHLGKSFDGNAAVADFSVTVQDNEYLTLLGPSGSGKTTLLRLIAGLDQPDTGRVLLNGRDITATPTHTRTIGFVQQKYALFPHLSVRENVSFGLRNHYLNPVADDAEIKRRVDAMLEIVGLRGLGDRGVGQISGGQKQRVSLARTLVTEPKICLLDEPLGALDANLRERMTVELRDIRAALGISFMHVTGNEDEALGMGDRVIVLDKGRGIQIDRPDVVFGRPRTVRVARHVNNYNILSGQVEQGQFVCNGHRLDLPKGSDSAVNYVIGVDRVSVNTAEAQDATGHVSIQAKFIASEFMGSRVLYLFEGPDNAVFEVERHLSRENPVDYGRGEVVTLSWPVAEVLTYAKDGLLLHAPELTEVAA